MKNINKVLISVQIVLLVANIVVWGLFIRDITSTPKVAAHPFICKVPYSLEYCHTHQAQMYLNGGNIR